MNSIRWRIFKYCQMYDAEASNAEPSNAEPSNAEDETDDETDDDMPGLVSMEECQKLSCGSEPDHEHPEPC